MTCCYIIYDAILFDRQYIFGWVVKKYKCLLSCIIRAYTENWNTLSQLTVVLFYQQTMKENVFNSIGPLIMYASKAINVQ